MSISPPLVRRDGEGMKRSGSEGWPFKPGFGAEGREAKQGFHKEAHHEISLDLQDRRNH
jgi:hypothetical protein